eukprot:gb/GEZN01006090.1/.p1 GENE.gb/GEZN01006090.1/~~gb/GEZN01006090.1/.p1  ORF type:complete len:476 (+),score=20.92 gb/GEZN01006090.1/:60-1487(+)
MGNAKSAASRTSTRGRKGRYVEDDGTTFPSGARSDKSISSNKYSPVTLIHKPPATADAAAERSRLSAATTPSPPSKPLSVATEYRLPPSNPTECKVSPAPSKRNVQIQISPHPSPPQQCRRTADGKAPILTPEVVSGRLESGSMVVVQSHKLSLSPPISSLYVSTLCTSSPSTTSPGTSRDSSRTNSPPQSPKSRGRLPAPSPRSRATSKMEQSVRVSTRSYSPDAHVPKTLRLRRIRMGDLSSQTPRHDEGYSLASTPRDSLATTPRELPRPQPLVPGPLSPVATPRGVNGLPTPVRYGRAASSSSLERRNSVERRNRQSKMSDFLPPAVSYARASSYGQGLRANQPRRGSLSRGSLNDGNLNFVVRSKGRSSSGSADNVSPRSSTGTSQLRNKMSPARDYKPAGLDLDQGGIFFMDTTPDGPSKGQPTADCASMTTTRCNGADPDMFVFQKKGKKAETGVVYKPEKQVFFAQH